MIALLVAGVCVDLLFRSQVAGLAGTIAVLACVAVLWVSGKLRNPQAMALTIVAALFGLFLCLRSSPWLIPLDALAAATLLTLAASIGRGGSVLDLPPSELALRLVRLLVAFVYAPALVFDRLAMALPLAGEPAREQLRVVARGLGLAVPVLVLVGLLLASADAVFASFFLIPVDPASWLGHLLGVAVGIWGASALVWLLIDPWEATPAVSTVRLGPTETSIVLAALVGLYGLFVAAQLVAAGAGESYILETTGLTRAEYARSGFFQLLWAAGITVAVLLGLNSCRVRTADTRGRMVVLNGLAVTLTLVVVVVAIRRLGLYDEAFGLTMLRLYSTTFAWWLGVVLVLVGIYLVTSSSRRWLVVAVGASALTFLAGMNVVNPERTVAEHNLARAQAGAEVDLEYLVGLSDDAVPTLVASVDQLSPLERRKVASIVCDLATSNQRDEGPPPRVWYGYNRSVAEADEARRSLCAP